MTLRVLRAAAAMLLVASGALMCAASWQRWAGACPWGDLGSGRCLDRQDDRYDFVAPTTPWVPLGDAAQLAGWSLLVLALAFVLLPRAFTGRRPGVASTVAQVGVTLAGGAVGAATLGSGLTGDAVDPVSGWLAGIVWFLVTPVLLVRLAVAARGWALTSAIFLILATPLVAAFSYAVGPYDARPWWEGISGVLTVTAGLCLLGAALGSGAGADRGVQVAGDQVPTARG